MTCEECSIKFTVFKRRVSPFVYCAREVIFCHLIHDAVSIQTRGLQCDACQGFHSSFRWQLTIDLMWVVATTDISDSTFGS
jgi:hypothetical protein